MWPFNGPKTPPRATRDELWERYSALRADVDSLTRRQDSVESAWAEALQRITKAIARQERANERAEARAPQPNGASSPHAREGDAAVDQPAFAGTGFARKWHQLQKGNLK